MSVQHDNQTEPNNLNSKDIAFLSALIAADGRANTSEIRAYSDSKPEFDSLSNDDVAYRRKKFGRCNWISVEQNSGTDEHGRPKPKTITVVEEDLIRRSLERVELPAIDEYESIDDAIEMHTKKLNYQESEIEELWKKYELVEEQLAEKVAAERADQIEEDVSSVRADLQDVRDNFNVTISALLKLIGSSGDELKKTIDRIKS